MSVVIRRFQIRSMWINWGRKFRSWKRKRMRFIKRIRIVWHLFKNFKTNPSKKFNNTKINSLSCKTSFWAWNLTRKISHRSSSHSILMLKRDNLSWKIKYLRWRKIFSNLTEQWRLKLRLWQINYQKKKNNYQS